jgi:prepilin signal peptidase PulO-like enzyme (type II secretory pathway)
MSSDNFKSLWNQQSTAMPDTKALLEKAMSLKKKTRNKIVAMNLLLFSTAVFIIAIIIYFDPQMITTKLGVVLVILAMVVFVTATNMMNKDVFKSSTTSSTKEYLDQFIRLQQKQEFLQKTMLTLYFIMLTLGIVLYMIEYAMRMPVWGALLTYGITLAWIALNWFYFRPRAIKKQQGKMNKMIEMLKKVNRELNAEN